MSDKEQVGVDTEHLDSNTSMVVSEEPKQRTLRSRIRNIVWDSLDKPPAERKYIFKIDCWILSYVCVSYFVKYLDQTNVANAYVSGMKEDLNFQGTQYNLVSTIYYCGYILGQVPSQYAINKIRPSIFLPCTELVYGALVMCMAAAKNVETIYALRFFIGLFESTAYVCIMTILSNFYLPDELGKRTCIFQTSSSAAQMFSGYLQSGLHQGLDGRYGIAAWKWLFIFDGIITIPVAIVGFFAIPDEPFTSKARWFTENDRKIGTGRLIKAKRNTRPKIALRDFIDLSRDWPLYLFCTAFTAHVLGIRLYGFMNLWLKADGGYSISDINNLPTAGYGAQIAATLTMAWCSDALKMRGQVIVVACIAPIIGSIILWVWPADNKSALFAGWYLLFLETGAGALFITWISETLSTSVEQRYLMIGMVELVAFTFSTWVPIYLYPADQAPFYKYAYPITFMFFVIEALCAIIIIVIQKLEVKGVMKNKHHKIVYEDEEEVEDEPEGSSEVESEPKVVEEKEKEV